MYIYRHFTKNVSVGAVSLRMGISTENEGVLNKSVWIPYQNVKVKTIFICIASICSSMRHWSFDDIHTMVWRGS